MGNYSRADISLNGICDHEMLQVQDGHLPGGVDRRGRIMGSCAVSPPGLENGWLTIAALDDALWGLCRHRLNPLDEGRSLTQALCHSRIGDAASGESAVDDCDVLKPDHNHQQ